MFFISVLCFVVVLSLLNPLWVLLAFVLPALLCLCCLWSLPSGGFGLLRVVALSLLSDPSPPQSGDLFHCVLYFNYTMKSRTNSDLKVITLRQSIKASASLKNAASVAFFDPAADPRHIAALLAHV